jgi:Ran GTPase-activating protein (RanGAP) involved in mRNA processing and transport
MFDALRNCRKKRRSEKMSAEDESFDSVDESPNDDQRKIDDSSRHHLARTAKIASDSDSDSAYSSSYSSYSDDDDDDDDDDISIDDSASSSVDSASSSSSPRPTRKNNKSAPNPGANPSSSANPSTNPSTNKPALSAAAAAALAAAQAQAQAQQEAALFGNESTSSLGNSRVKAAEMFYPHSFSAVRATEQLERTGPLSRAVSPAFVAPFRSKSVAAPIYAACLARPRPNMALLTPRGTALMPNASGVASPVPTAISSNGSPAATTTAATATSTTGTAGGLAASSAAVGVGSSAESELLPSLSHRDSSAASAGGGFDPSVSPRGVVGKQLDELRRRRTKATRALQQRLYDPANRVDTQPVLVWFLDDSCEQLDVSLDITALDLLYLLADQVRFEWPEMFALCEVELSGAEPRWLPMDRPLHALGLDLAQSQRRLQCRLKYERRAIDRVYKDARLLRLAMLQARESILGGRWPCPEPVAVRLASYQMQADFGDYDTALHRAGYVALGGLEQFLPLPLLTNRQESDQYWEERLTSLHQQHRGLSVGEAQVLYLDECRRSVPLFGSHHFAKTTPPIAVVSEGVLEFLDDVRYRFYAFEQLRGWQRKASVANITVAPKKHDVTATADDDEQSDSVRSAHSHNSDDDEDAAASAVSERDDDDHDDDDDDDDERSSDSGKQRKSAPLEKRASTAARKVLSVQCANDAVASEIVELITGFFVIGGGVRASRVIKGIDIDQIWLPPAVLFKPATSDGKSALLNGDNAATSRLREALLHYRRECATRHVMPLQALLTTIDRALDHNLVLRTLALSGVGLDDRGFELMAAALSMPSSGFEDNLALTSLDVSRNSLSPDSADAIVKLLAASPHLRHIDLSHNKLTSYGVMPTLPALAKLARLSSLRLAANQISNKGVTALANTLKANGALRLLDLSDNKIGDKAVASLATLIQARSTMSLNVARNRIGPHGVEVLMTALTVAMMTGGSLAELNIASNSFGNKGMVCVANAMAGNAPIERLNVSHNKLTEASGVEIGRVLGKCKTVLALAIAGNQLGRKGWRSLTGGLALNHTLLTLELSHCDLDRYSIGLVCTAAQQGGVLESLSLRGNALGADATRSVCTLIGQTHSLLHLDIGESHMQSKDVIMLAEALVGPPDRRLARPVGRAHLSALDMQFLAEALASNKSLHRIVLDGNALRDDELARNDTIRIALATDQ